MRIRRSASLAIMLLSTVSRTAAAGDEILDRLQSLYRCPIYSLLTTVRSEAKARSRNMLTLRIDDHGYLIDCFIDGKTVIGCVGNAVQYEPKSASHRSPAQLASLAALGFDITAPDYFIIRIPVTDANSLMAAAGIIVESLYRADDLTPERPLSYDTPLVPGHDLFAVPTSTCDPVS